MFRYLEYDDTMQYNTIQIEANGIEDDTIQYNIQQAMHNYLHMHKKWRRRMAHRRIPYSMTADDATTVLAPSYSSCACDPIRTDPLRSQRSVRAALYKRCVQQRLRLAAKATKHRRVSCS